ncbi:MAG: hypothetical protein FWH59_01030 [Lentimicrobiaceae bacterium]|nr:hypothetical protein [Lentimicrobiaceae bacterium]
MKKNIFNILVKILYLFLFLIVACNPSNRSQPVIEIQETVEFPIGYIAQSIGTNLFDLNELYPIQELFLDNFMQMHTQYEGTSPTLTTNFPDEWGVVIVERLPEGHELFQIQSLNREWVYLVITSGYGNQRIVDILPVAINLVNQSNEIRETEIWTTEREPDNTFTVTKKYEWVRSIENITQKEYDDNPQDFLRKKLVIEKYIINDFCRFEKIVSEDIPDYSAVIFYYQDEKPEDWEENVQRLQAFCEDYSILFVEASKNFNQVALFDYKLNYVTTFDISPYMDLQEGIIIMKKDEKPKSAPCGSYERMKIEIKRYFKIVET